MKGKGKEGVVSGKEPIIAKDDISTNEVSDKLLSNIIHIQFLSSML